MSVYTILLYCLVSLLGVAFLVAWRRGSKLSKKIDEMHSLTEGVRAHVNASQAELKGELSTLVRREVAYANGDPGFTTDMTIGEVMELHPEAEKVLAAFHLGGCSSCSITDYHRLGDAVRDYGVDGEALLAALNGLFDA